MKLDVSLSDLALIASISQVILAGVIGTVTVFIARQQARIAQQQWQTNQNQFRLHFFDRRIAVYDAVMELCARISQKGTVTQEQLREYVKKTREASFFFNDEIQTYCDQLYKNGVNLMTADQVIKTAPDSPSYPQMAEMYRDLMLWFVEQVDKGAKPRFERFLRIRE
jgi:hypothetical protein